MKKWIKNKKKGRKAQEEIVGFVLIVVIVAIVFVILLSIFIRQDKSTIEKESIDVLHYLRSMMNFRTNCSTSYGGEFLILEDIAEECYNQEKCENSGEDVCELLKRTIKDSVIANWNINENGNYKGYLFNATYSNLKEIAFIKEGNCSKNKIGNEISLPYSGENIVISLEICN